MNEAGHPACAPVSSLLESRVVCAGIIGAAAAHVALALAGHEGWPCPVRSALGVPCPGCGLGRACALLLRGDWLAAMRLHAFAPLLLMTLVLVCATALMPDLERRSFAAMLSRVEAKTRLVPALLAALIIYWLVRFALDASAFLQLLT